MFLAMPSNLLTMASLSLRTAAEERSAIHSKHSSTSLGTEFHVRKGSGCCNDCNAKRSFNASVEKSVCATTACLHDQE
jgi:hypothetical protein